MQNVICVKSFNITVLYVMSYHVRHCAMTFDYIMHYHYLYKAVAVVMFPNQAATGQMLLASGSILSLDFQQIIHV